MNDATCKTCPWWYAWPAADGNPSTGDCRRMPPRRTVLDYDTDEGSEPATGSGPRGEEYVLPATQIHLDADPRTTPDYWCGEHPDRDATRRDAQAQGTP